MGKLRVTKPRSRRRRSGAPVAGFSEGAAPPYRAAKKRATNVSIDAELFKLARELGINLSDTLEQRLREVTKAERERRWKAENRAYLDSYSRYIEEHGIFGEDLRTW